MNKLNDKQEKDRLAFYALYHGQKVAQILECSDLFVYAIGDTCHIHEIDCIQLTNLSDITDEHAIEVSVIVYEFFTGEMDPRIDNIKKWAGIYAMKSSAICDYLRRNGYLLPYAGYSSQQLIALGWVKLRTNN